MGGGLLVVFGVGVVTIVTQHPHVVAHEVEPHVVPQNCSARAHDGIRPRYTSPVDRGPTLPTFSCEIQLLTPGRQTRAHRHNSTAIYFVFRGEGRTDVAGEPLEWTQGDIFCVPPWTWHHHENPASEDAILYSVDDWPAMAKMGFYRMESEEDQG